MAKTPTRRQHYVWRFHLAAWAVEGKIAVLRKDGKGFVTNPANVAAERDFYRLPRLTDGDVEFIHAFIDHLPQGEELKSSARGWLLNVSMADWARRELDSHADAHEARRALEEFEIEADENLMGAFELEGQPLVQRLREEDSSFRRADEDATMRFSHFIAVQMLRTKGTADRIGDGVLPSGHEGRLERTWPIFRHILASNVGFSIFTQRREFTLRTVRASGGLRFITSDQPVVNLVAPIGDNDLALYLPVTPTVAVLLEHADARSHVAVDALSDDHVDQLNRRLFAEAHEQVVGDDLTYLRSLSAEIVGPAARSPASARQDRDGQ
ncbi:DUF4238 domain-containing protein [Brevundimonas mediterranea]|uniref:DUF4238 domain-containing protein n=1 Tax=Brevundimonas mediterranea TaxID=74329 RepID=A0A7W6EZB0_9CAUL|nr:DUF4238 domain-containing protein [Brevundimonas mediterranea]MBB3871659.1 hypothetical protein [Brevundimonas mediterranea]